MIEAIHHDARLTRRVIAIGFSYIAAFALGMAASVGVMLALGFGVERAVLPMQDQIRSSSVITQPATQPTELPIARTADTLAGAREAMRLGSPDAPVQIVVFADPLCAFCRQSALGTEREIIEGYVKPGKASLVYRHFAFLSPQSQRIAVAMECAAEQGGQAFWDFHGQVFEHPSPADAGQATDAMLASWAQAAKLDAAAFQTCLVAPEATARVNDDMRLGRKLGVLGTPTLFINGRPMPGALPFDFVKGTIESELARAAGR